VEHDGDALIETAIAKFNAAAHEPPVVIGHPADNAPAYGWVEGLKKQGNLLLAKFKQVHPDFADMIKNGLFKKRSAAFYPDGTLRHVGFLGAMPPAVKGLSDVAFAEGDAVSFDFNEGAATRDSKEQTNKKINNEKKEVQNMFQEKLIKFLEFLGIDVSKVPADALPKEAPKGTELPTFSETDLKKITDAAEKKGRDAAAAEFSEQQKQTYLATLKGDIAVFCESLIKAGKITPATVAFGLPEILFSVAQLDNQIEFGEKKEKFTAFDRMKALLESATPLVIFKEVATRDKNAGGAGSAGAKLETLTRAKMKEMKDLTYNAAFAEVQKENPELTQEYTQELSGN
jgi:hypothetical protein